MISSVDDMAHSLCFSFDLPTYLNADQVLGTMLGVGKTKTTLVLLPSQNLFGLWKSKQLFKIDHFQTGHLQLVCKQSTSICTTVVMLVLHKNIYLFKRKSFFTRIHML